MKDFRDWGVRVRRDLPRNYYSVWNNLVTTRLDLGDPVPLDTQRPEFIDLCLGTRCNAKCDFCYVSAGPAGFDWPGICETWKAWLSSFPADTPIDPETSGDTIWSEILGPPEPGQTLEEVLFQVEISKASRRYGAVYTEKMFQVALGGTSEPTIHPDFTKFLQTVYETRVVPNYTTNGILLSDKDKAAEILEATRNFCGGVAVSFGNKNLRGLAGKAVRNLLEYGDCKVMIHEIISDKASVDDMLALDREYGKDIHYHVLLPLMAHGRSTESMTREAWEYLVDRVKATGMTNVAFGANFLPWMAEYPGAVNVWEYPSEVYSENVLLRDHKITITKNSFDLKPIDSWEPSHS